MDQTQLISTVVDVLHRQKIPWCIHGAMAANCYTSHEQHAPHLDVAVAADNITSVFTDLAAQGLAGRDLPSVAQLWCADDRRSQVNLYYDEVFRTFPARSHVRLVLGRELPVAALADVVRGLRWISIYPFPRTTKCGSVEQIRAAMDLKRLAASNLT